eukprot:TRINITY_DN66859_c5_g2_i1.p2 TRINITY_DN66859_c5_g2~~TRINITY_DN66859_c5_g2_i1.p2  ORF type:complete len:137 (+),score=1.88 TRINITY_DN66859_c5_g2_i1:44-454(+)
MVVYALWVINKTGGLIFDREFASGLPELSTNAFLKFASAFHTQHAIAAQLSPVPDCKGIEVIEAECFKLFCYETPTAIKFIVITDSTVQVVDSLLRDIYQLYSDYVLKNPFYEVEQPIRVEHWETKLAQLVGEWNV